MLSEWWQRGPKMPSSAPGTVSMQAFGGVEAIKLWEELEMGINYKTENYTVFISLSTLI